MPPIDRLATAPQTFVVEVALAPQGALSRLRAGINRPKKRALGVFKLENEFVGIVEPPRFEIWERRRHAIHAHGQVRPGHGGARIEMRFTLSSRSRILIAVFFALYALLAAGFMLQSDEVSQTALRLIVLVIGAATAAGIFVTGARKQRADLLRFIDGLFADLPRR